MHPPTHPPSPSRPAHTPPYAKQVDKSSQRHPITTCKLVPLPPRTHPHSPFTPVHPPTPSDAHPPTTPPHSPPTPPPPQLLSLAANRTRSGYANITAPPPEKPRPEPIRHLRSSVGRPDARCPTELALNPTGIFHGNGYRRFFFRCHDYAPFTPPSQPPTLLPATNGRTDERPPMNGYLRGDPLWRDPLSVADAQRTRRYGRPDWERTWPTRARGT